MDRQGNVAGFPTPAILFAIIAAISYFVLNHTTYGRSVYATGGSPASAWLSGIPVRLIMLSVFAISGLTSGFAAVLTLSRVMSASMKTLVSLELDSIAAVTIGGISLLGGRGSVIGAVIGVLIIGVINNGMSVLGTGPGQQGVIKGAIIIAAVAVDYLRRQRQTLG